VESLVFQQTLSLAVFGHEKPTKPTIVSENRLQFFRSHKLENIMLEISSSLSVLFQIKISTSPTFISIIGRHLMVFHFLLHTHSLAVFDNMNCRNSRFIWSGTAEYHKMPISIAFIRSILSSLSFAY